MPRSGDVPLGGSAELPPSGAARLAGSGKVPLRIWLMAARPRTLPAAIAPVLVGTALAGSEGTFRPLALAAALIGSVFIQIGTNLSNDYSDARRGADTDDRLGPVRVTAGGLVPPRRVLVATWLAFGMAVLVGGYLIYLVGWELLAIGAASILAGVLYTGGPRPYGYEGLGELFVFLFFGVVAVTSSYYIQREVITALVLALSIPVGLLSAAILMVNNIRDVDTDRRAGKHTLAVRLGRERARQAYAAALVLSYVIVAAVAVVDRRWPLLLGGLSAPLVAGLVRSVSTRTDGVALNAALARTGMLLAVFTILLSAGLLISG